MDAVQEIDTENIICTNREKYHTHVLPRLQEIYTWLREGMTEYSIADSLGISQTTLIEYKKVHPEIIEIYKRAREERNTTVMNSMYQKANGAVAQVKQEKLARDGSKISLVSEIYTPPDVNAADLYLRNNNPDYKGAKDISSVTLNQYNFNRPQLERELQKLEQELKQLESVEATDVQVIDDGGK